VELFGDILVCPCLRVLPMGWSHSVEIAQAVHESVIASTRIGKMLRPITDTSSCLLGVGRFSICVDDLNIFLPDDGTGRAAVLGNALLTEAAVAYSSVGWRTNTKKLVPMSYRANVLGVAADGMSHTFSPRPEKLAQAISITRFFVRYGHISGRGMQCLLGLWCWFMLLRRPLLSVLNAAYAFGRKYDKIQTSRKLWRTARAELDLLVRLSPLMIASTKRPWWRKVLCSDASPFGAGIMSTQMSPSLCVEMSAWSLQRPSQDLHNLTNQRLQHLLPAPLWTHAFSYYFQFRGHINRLEVGAASSSVLWAISHSDCMQTWIASVLDSQVSLHAIHKGRSSAPSLIYPLRRLNALLLSTGNSLAPFYIQSNANPADGPSRQPRFLKPPDHDVK
jgi:hypothetical protein